MTSLGITTTAHYIFMRLRNWQLSLEPWLSFLQSTSQKSASPTLFCQHFHRLILAHLLKSMKASETVAPKLKLIIRMWPHMLVAAFTSVNEFNFSTFSLSLSLSLCFIFSSCVWHAQRSLKQLTVCLTVHPIFCNKQTNKFFLLLSR